MWAVLGSDRPGHVHRQCAVQMLYQQCAQCLTCSLVHDGRLDEVRQLAVDDAQGCTGVGGCQVQLPGCLHLPLQFTCIPYCLYQLLSLPAIGYKAAQCTCTHQPLHTNSTDWGVQQEVSCHCCLQALATSLLRSLLCRMQLADMAVRKGIAVSMQDTQNSP